MNSASGSNEEIAREKGGRAGRDGKFTINQKSRESVEYGMVGGIAGRFLVNVPAPKMVFRNEERVTVPPGRAARRLRY